MYFTSHRLISVLRQPVEKILLVVFVTQAICLSAYSNDVRDYNQDLEKVNLKAKQAREDEDFVRLDALANERMSLLRDAASSGDLEGQIRPWVEGFKALAAVDGVSASTGFLVDGVEETPGLVDQCRYADAIEVLLKSLEGFETDDSPMLGEVVVRIFEVVQQAKGILQGASDPNSDAYLMSDEQLLDLIRQAEARDPCAAVCTSMRHFLVPSDPNEAFLTADVRKTFTERQQDLLKMSHPLVEVNAELDERALNWPVLKLHAPSEFVKADSLSVLLKDLENTLPLVLDAPFESQAGTDSQAVALTGDGPLGPPSYRVPGVIEDLVDESGELIQLLYGRVFLMQRVDLQGRRRPAFVYLDTSVTPPVWKKNFLAVLTFEPAEKNMNESEDARALNELLKGYVPVEQLEMLDGVFRVYDYPLEETKKFLEKRMHILRVKDCYRILDTKFNPSRNDPAFLGKQLSYEKGALATSPALMRRALANYKKLDKTSHALSDFFQRGEGDSTATMGSAPPFRAVILAGDDDGSESAPKWFSGSEGDETQVLNTTKGIPLVLHIPDNPSEAYLELQQPGAHVFFPLSFEAVPGEVYASCKLAQKLFDDLKRAGYSQQNATELIKKMWAGKLPLSKLPKQVKNFYFEKNSGNQSLDPNSGDEQKLPDWMKPFIPPQELLAGFGFRYIRDGRGNLILHKNLVTGESIGDVGETTDTLMSGNTEANALKGNAYAIRTSDGLRDIRMPQMYGWKDYLDIKTNVIDVHLAKVASLHPCLASVETVAQQSLNPLINPSERPPEWVGQGEDVEEAKQVAAGANSSGDTFIVDTSTATEVLFFGDRYVFIDRSSETKTLTDYGIVPYTEYREAFVQPHAFTTIERLKSIIGEKATPTLVKALNKLCHVYAQVWVPVSSTGSPGFCPRHPEVGLIDTSIPQTVKCPKCRELVQKRQLTTREVETPNASQMDYASAWLGDFGAIASGDISRGFDSDRGLVTYFTPPANGATGQKTIDRSPKQVVASLYSQSYGSFNTSMGNLGGAFGQAGSDVINQTEVIAGISLNSARFYVAHGNYHNAILNYNDALDVLHQGLPFAPRKYRSKLRDIALLEQVPDPDRANRFVNQLRNAISQEVSGLTIQLELAGVLKRAGLDASADRIWSHVNNTAEFYVKPLLELAEKFFQSYGMQVESSLRTSVERIEKVFRVANAAVRKFDVNKSYLPLAVETNYSVAELKSHLGTVAELGKIIPRSRTEDQEKELDVAEASLRGLYSQLSFADWIRVQNVYSERGGLLAKERLAINFLQQTPFFHSSQKGFAHLSVSELFGKAKTAYPSFIKQKEEWTASDESGACLIYLMGAYWVDRGELSSGRKAFADASRVFKMYSEASSDPASKLLAKLNSFWCIICMESVNGVHDGIREMRMDFSEGLIGQFFAWSRQWFAAGLPGDHATQQRNIMTAVLNRVTSKQFRFERPRWFFADYESDLAGPIPDPFLLKFFEERPLDDIERDVKARLEAEKEIGKLEKEKENIPNLTKKVQAKEAETAPAQEAKNKELAALKDRETKISKEIQSQKEKVKQLAGANLSGIFKVVSEIVVGYSNMNDIELKEEIALGSD